MPLTVREEIVGEVRLLEIRGRVDSTTAPAFGDKLIPALTTPAARVLVDLDRLEYISSAGFRILLLAAKQAEQHGGVFALCGLSGKVYRLFDLGGFLDLFSIHGTRDEGLAAIA